jgi:hypothetical protein
MPDNDIRARLYAVEILLAEMIADRVRGTPHPQEIAVATLQVLQPAIEGFPLGEQTLDAEARMRQSIADAIADLLRLAISRLD